MATPVLEMQNVEKNFGGVRAIDNFSVMLEPGKIHGLIGPNGAYTVVSAPQLFSL